MKKLIAATAMVVAATIVGSFAFISKAKADGDKEYRVVIRSFPMQCLLINDLLEVLSDQKYKKILDTHLIIGSHDVETSVWINPQNEVMVVNTLANDPTAAGCIVSKGNTNTELSGFNLQNQTTSPDDKSQ